VTAIVDFSDVAAHLNLTGSPPQAELRRLMDAATSFVERNVGAVVPRAITETVVPTGRFIDLSAPVISVTSMTVAYGYPETYTVADWTIEEPSSSLGALSWPRNSGRRLVADYGVWRTSPVTVVYQGGRSPVPADLYEATLDYIKWRWLSQRGPAPLPTPGDEYAVAPSATVPYRVMEIIDGYRPLPALGA
jgi:hypothetical protein